MIVFAQSLSHIDKAKMILHSITQTTVTHLKGTQSIIWIYTAKGFLNLWFHWCLHNQCEWLICTNIITLLCKALCTDILSLYTLVFVSLCCYFVIFAQVTNCLPHLQITFGTEHVNINRNAPSCIHIYFWIDSKCDWFICLYRLMHAVMHSKLDLS